MAKQGMKRPGSNEKKKKRSKNGQAVPEIQAKANLGEQTAVNNQWTNNQKKKDNRERRDGPGGSYS